MKNKLKQKRNQSWFERFCIHHQLEPVSRGVWRDFDIFVGDGGVFKTHEGVLLKETFYQTCFAIARNDSMKFAAFANYDATEVSAMSERAKRDQRVGEAFVAAKYYLEHAIKDGVPGWLH